MTEAFNRFIAAVRRRQLRNLPFRGRVIRRTVLAEYGQGDSRVQLVAVTYASGANRIVRVNP